MKKRWIQTLTALFLVASLMIAPVFGASAGNGAVAGPEITLEEQRENLIAQVLEESGSSPFSTASQAERIARINEKYQSILQLQQNAQSLRSIPPETIQLNVTRFKQDTSYYCGPATLKQTLHYINGTSLSQSTYASSAYLNTDTPKPNGEYYTTDTRMVQCLNNLQSRNDYFEATVHNKATMNQYIYTGLSMWNSPPVLIIRTTGTDAYWGYEADHFLNASGITVGGMISLVDPAGNCISSNGIYARPDDEVYEAVIKHDCKAIIY